MRPGWRRGADCVLFGSRTPSGIVGLFYRRGGLEDAELLKCFADGRNVVIPSRSVAGSPQFQCLCDKKPVPTVPLGPPITLSKPNEPSRVKLHEIHFLQADTP